MNAKMNAARTKFLAASLALAAAIGATLTAAAGTVQDTVKKNRYATTGCKYENSFSTGGSIGIWVKSITSYDSLVSIFGSCHVNSSSYGSEQGLLLFLNGNQNFGFRVAGSKNGSVARNDIVAASSSSKLNDGSWHFLMGTFDKSSCKMYLYIDGVQAGTADIDVDSIVSTRCFTINAMGTTTEGSSGGSESYGAGCVGLYAEATIWDKALSASEVATLYTRRAKSDDDGLIGYWPLGRTAANLASNAVTRNDGSRPRVYRYFLNAVADSDFFEDPPAIYVVPQSWVDEHGYVQSANASFNTIADPATNLADAVSAAAENEIVYLLPGTHKISSEINITKANLMITGRYLGESVDEVVVDAQELCRHFRSHTDYSGKDGWVFDGLTLVNGRATTGGSIYARSKTGKILNCVFEANAATNGNGGAFHSYTANGTVVSNCVFRRNSATANGGAVYTQQNAASVNDRVIFSGCVVTNNTAMKGGGFYAERAMEINDCLLGWNTTTASDSRGGNVALGSCSRVIGTTFTGSCTSKYGGCVELGWNAADVVISNCSFVGMSPTASYGVFHFDGASATIVNCVFTNTTWNTAIFFPSGSASYLVRQCLFGENTGTGPVVSDRNAKPRFENCTILASKFDTKDKDSAQNVLVNCILPNADITSSGAYVNILTNCLVKSVSGGTQDSGVMTGSPRFTDAEHGDYTLQRGSPCREKGLSLDWMGAGSVDLLGNPRVVDKYGIAFSAEALPDLGCYEIQEYIPGTMVIFR